MRILLLAKEELRRVFSNYYQIGETIQEDYDVAIIIRDSSIQPQVIEEVVDGTRGNVPVVVMTGPEDEVGQAYVEMARKVGIADEYILQGTEWRVSDVERYVQDLLKNPKYPSPKIFSDSMHVSIEKEFDFPKPSEAILQPESMSNEHLMPSHPQEVVAVMGLNGGVGVTTIATSLMAQLREGTGRHVRLVDTSPMGDICYHLNIEDKSKGLRHTLYGEVVITNGDMEMIQQELQKAGDVVIVDAGIHLSNLDDVLKQADHILFIVTPSQLDYLKLKEMEGLLDHRTIICINKVDNQKPLQYSYVSLFEKDFGHRPIVTIHESDEVIQSLAGGVPAYDRMKEEFDLLFSHMKGAVLSGQ